MQASIALKIELVTGNFYHAMLACCMAMDALADVRAHKWKGGDWRSRILQCLFACIALFVLAGCSPVAMTSQQGVAMSPILEISSFVSFDGVRLPLRRWLPDKPAQAVIIAVHGFNDYSLFIDAAASYFAAQGMAVYAYDQRGFGAAPRHGRWAGQETMSHDLYTFIQLIQQRFPDQQVFVLGESMGAAVVLTTLASYKLELDGVILSAPAVWGWNSMPFWQAWALKLAVKIMPAMTFTGESLRVVASDNREMLITFSQDPLVIKATRVDSVYGLVNLMQSGYEAVQVLQLPAFIAYGEHDEIIPKKPVLETFGKLSKEPNQQRLYVYRDGYHMLMRDLQAKVVWQDMLVWMQNHDAVLPSLQQGLSSKIQ